MDSASPPSALSAGTLLPADEPEVQPAPGFPRPKTEYATKAQNHIRTASLE